MGTVAEGGQAEWVAKSATRGGGPASLLAATVSSDGRYLAVGGGDRKVHIWDARSQQYVQVHVNTSQIECIRALCCRLWHQEGPYLGCAQPAVHTAAPRYYRCRSSCIRHTCTLLLAATTGRSISWMRTASNTYRCTLTVIVRLLFCESNLLCLEIHCAFQNQAVLHLHTPYLLLNFQQRFD